MDERGKSVVHNVLHHAVESVGAFLEVPFGKYPVSDAQKACYDNGSLADTTSGKEYQCRERKTVAQKPSHPDDLFFLGGVGALLLFVILPPSLGFCLFWGTFPAGEGSAVGKYEDGEHYDQRRKQHSSTVKYEAVPHTVPQKKQYNLTNGKRCVNMADTGEYSGELPFFQPL